jgi:hypothetical protein
MARIHHAVPILTRRGGRTGTGASHRNCAWRHPSALVSQALAKDGIPTETLVLVESTLDASKTSFLLPPSLFKRSLDLLTEQEILICWNECPSGRPVPLNVKPPARARLPISPGNQRIQETQLLSYYQGKDSVGRTLPRPCPESVEVDVSPLGVQEVPHVSHSS